MNQIFTWEMDGNGCFTISIHFELVVWACQAHAFLAPPLAKSPPVAPNPPERPRGSPPPPFGPPGCGRSKEYHKDVAWKNSHTKTPRKIHGY